MISLFGVTVVVYLMGMTSSAHFRKCERPECYQHVHQLYNPYDEGNTEISCIEAALSLQRHLKSFLSPF